MPAEKLRPIIIKKKIVKGHGHHGGSWKIAYADFATAMMSLFIVLWMMNSNAKVREAVAGYFKDPAGKGDKSGTADAGRDKTALPPGNPQEPPKQEMEKVKTDLEKALMSLPNFQTIRQYVLITVSDEGVRMELIENAKGMFFTNGSAEPTQEGSAVIIAVSGVINKLPNRVVIEGHTDSVPYVGSGDYTNWELSSARASAARILMTRGGLRPNQLYEIRGFADQQLRLPKQPQDPSNRRISIIVLNLPGKAQPRKVEVQKKKRFIFF